MTDSDILISAGIEDQEDIISKSNNRIDNRVKHTKILKSTISRLGWPTVPMVGAEASYAAWLIAQHSDYNLDFQKYCLSLMEEPYRLRLIDPVNYAYLIDRVAVNSGKPQIYGTQWETATKVKPIKNMKEMVLLRHEVGLAPFEYSLAIRNGTMTLDELNKSPVPIQIKIGRFNVSRL